MLKGNRYSKFHYHQVFLDFMISIKAFYNKMLTYTERMPFWLPEFGSLFILFLSGAFVFREIVSFGLELKGQEKKLLPSILVVFGKLFFFSFLNPSHIFSFFFFWSF